MDSKWSERHIESIYFNILKNLNITFLYEDCKGIMSIIIGLGSGRCGTKTLHSLINMQPNSVCFHEVNPSAMAWDGAESSVLSLLTDFSNTLEGKERALAIDRVRPTKLKSLDRYLTLDEVNTVGDVASYYLPYVGYIINSGKEVLFPCIIRDREKVIESFINKVKVTDRLFKKIRLRARGKLPYRNHWSLNDKYIADKFWDRLFPKMGKDLDLYDAISMYYDSYYEEVERLISMYGNVKLFSVEDFNSEGGRKKILEFCGISDPVLNKPVHENIGR